MRGYDPRKALGVLLVPRARGERLIDLPETPRVRAPHRPAASPSIWTRSH
jgi:hypothetical protein